MKRGLEKNHKCKDCVFSGVKAFAHIPKDERKKLDSKSRKSVFMGYGETTKAIDCMIKQRKRCSSADMSFLMNRSVDLKSILKWNHRKECILNIPTKTQKRLASPRQLILLNLYHDVLILSEDSQTIMVTDVM